MQKELRLQKRDDFQKVYKYGKSAANHQLVVYYLPVAGEPAFRAGISISKKIGGAVVRNRMKRVLKEIIRGMEASIAPGYYLVFIVRKPALEMEFAELQKSVIHVIKRTGLYKKS